MPVTIDLVDQAEPLSSLAEPARAALANVAREISYSKEERLVPIGRPLRRLLVPTEGLVKLVGVSPNGLERILAVHRPGDLVGPGVLFDPHEHDYEAVAMDDGRALSIRRRDLLVVGRDHPSIVLVLAREVSRLLAAMTDRMMSATSTEVPVRLSRLLLEFAGGNGTRSGSREPAEFVPLSHPLTHESMAQIVGASRPHTSTVLRDLEGLGAVRRKSRDGLLVLPDRLREIVENGDVDGLEEPRARPRVKAAVGV